MKKLILTKGQYALVDDEDYKSLKKWKWTANKNRSGFYAYRNKRINGKCNMILLHRQIMQPPKDMVVDHIDHNGLNNQRSNLRICTPSQNMRNANAKRKNNFKGVGKAANSLTYTAQIHLPQGIKVHLGSYKTAIEAAFAYNIAAVSLFGEYACLNEIPGHTNFNLIDLKRRYIGKE